MLGEDRESKGWSREANASFPPKGQCTNNSTGISSAISHGARLLLSHLIGEKKDKGEVKLQVQGDGV